MVNNKIGQLAIVQFYIVELNICSVFWLFKNALVQEEIVQFHICSIDFVQFYHCSSGICSQDMLPIFQGPVFQSFKDGNPSLGSVFFSPLYRVDGHLVDYSLLAVSTIAAKVICPFCLIPTCPSRMWQTKQYLVKKQTKPTSPR